MDKDDARHIASHVRAALADASQIAERVGAMPPGLESVLIVAHLGALVDEAGAMDMGEFLYLVSDPPKPNVGGNGGRIRTDADEGTGRRPGHPGTDGGTDD